MNFMPTKPYTWSYSKLKAFETCPKRHWHVDIAKDVKEEQSSQLVEGNEIHEALDARLGRRKVPLPMGLAYLEPWCEKIERGAEGGRLETEVKTAFTRDFGATGYFARDVWFRGKIDVLVVKGPIAFVVDWKTGKVVPDSPQLLLMAQSVFSMFPEVQAVRTEFIWTAANESTRMDVSRADMAAFWSDMLPRVERMEQAWRTTTYQAKPGGLCRRWCPVDTCPHHGAGLGAGT